MSLYDAIRAGLVQRYGMSNPNAQANEVGRVYGLLNTLSENENNRMKQSRMSLLDELPPPDSSEAMSRDEIKRSQIAQSGPSPQERWRQQIDLLIRSGNPTLQKQGLSMLQGYHEKITDKLEGNGILSAHGKTAVDAGFTPGTQAFYDYVQQLAKKTEMFEKAQYSVEDLGKLEMPDPNNPGKWMPVPVGTLKSDAQSLGIRRKDDISSESAGKAAMVDTAIRALPTLQKSMRDADGNINIRIVSAAHALTKADELGLKGAAKYLGGELANYSPQELESAENLAHSIDLGIQAITRTETGAAMAVTELDNTRSRFMPKFGDSAQLIEKKIAAYEYFLNNLQTIMRTNIKDPNQAAAEVNRAVDKAFEAVKDNKGGLSKLPPLPGKGRIVQE